MTDESGSALSIVADILGIVTALFFLWELGARFNIIPGASPIQRVQHVVGFPSPGRGQPPPPIPTLDELEPLEAPSNLQLSGSCDGYTLTWDPVEGAERYFIEDDRGSGGTTTDPEFHLDFLFPDGEIHELRVSAATFGGAPRSEPSEAKEAVAC